MEDVGKELIEISDENLLVVADVQSKLAKVREQISEFIGIEAGPMPVINPQQGYHLVAGNKMRYRGEVTIKYDSKWQRQLNEEEISMLDKVASQVDPVFQRIPQTVS